MANEIRLKRGSGSDPGASDLVVGEVAIRTDVGKLFTKMDNGSVSEIAGGGSDIAVLLLVVVVVFLLYTSDAADE